MKTSPLAYSRVVGLALPFILANSAVPLLGLVDTAVIGNLGSAQDLGAIAFGALIFSFVYWGFGFLRMGTTGFVAQAAGASDYLEVRAVLGRSLLLAAGLGCLLVVLQLPVQWLAVTFLSGSADVEQMAALYFSIRIWGAPATLIGFVGTGFLVGMGRSKTLLALQLFLNGLNVVLDILLAGIMGLGAAGIALGTVISEWCAVLLGAILLHRVLLEMNSADDSFWPLEKILDKRKLAQSLYANLDIMIRTLLLVFSFAFFTNQGARFGDIALAANHILLQIISFSAFFLDGFAFAAEGLVGRAFGAGDSLQFMAAVRRTSVLAVVSAVVLASIVLLFGGDLVAGLTDLPAVRQAASNLTHLAAVYILLSVAAFQLDGIFIGASCTRQMCYGAIQSVLFFLLVCWMLVPRFEITGLWWAMIAYVVVRAAVLFRYFPQTLKKCSD
ncbi:MAG: MATE family efflux transporter [Pseudomonadota bacterium]|nr:MATE family efflux transporter [Pseudomonadota bacterium]